MRVDGNISLILLGKVKTFRLEVKCGLFRSDYFLVTIHSLLLFLCHFLFMLFFLFCNFFVLFFFCYVFVVHSLLVLFVLLPFVVLLPFIFALFLFVVEGSRFGLRRCFVVSTDFILCYFGNIEK